MYVCKAFYVCHIRFICVQIVMHLILATLKQSNFWYLLRFLIISSVHGAFLLSINVLAQNIELKIFAKVLKKF